MVDIKDIQGKVVLSDSINKDVNKKKTSNRKRKANLVGAKIGRLTVIEECGRNKHKGVLWKCLCECGKYIVRTSAVLLSGDCLSCGCYGKEQRLKAITKHGQSRSRLYHCWQGMKSRCYNKNNSEYHRYGGRGINVCDEWLSSFELFSEWAKRNGYEENLTIDRIDFDKGYLPENCRWITVVENAKNTSHCVIIEIQDIKDTIRGWSFRLNISENTFRRKYKEVGKTIFIELIKEYTKTGNKNLFSKK